MLLYKQRTQLMNCTFEVPAGVSQQVVAETLAEYLVGSEEFKELKGVRGPFKLEKEQKWQLDSSNDYWLRFEKDQAVISFRYHTQEAKTVRMINFFKNRHPQTT